MRDYLLSEIMLEHCIVHFLCMHLTAEISQHNAFTLTVTWVITNNNIVKILIYFFYIKKKVCRWRFAFLLLISKASILIIFFFLLLCNQFLFRKYGFKFFTQNSTYLKKMSEIWNCKLSLKYITHSFCILNECVVSLNRLCTPVFGKNTV